LIYWLVLNCVIYKIDLLFFNNKGFNFDELKFRSLYELHAVAAAKLRAVYLKMQKDPRCLWSNGRLQNFPGTYRLLISRPAYEGWKCPKLS